MILVVDLYDSFVETLARYVREAGAETQVVRHDTLDLKVVEDIAPRAIILSPGPGRPSDIPICTQIIQHFPQLPILGVCLGHQALADAYGGATILSPDPMHGRPSLVRHEGDPLFSKVPNPFQAGRYHSLLGRLPDEGPLKAIAWSSDGLVMALRHRDRPHMGVQFHPESLLTPDGHQIIANFLQDGLG
ncbi:aminodeoxychorismate/anthranilate synthase component II [Parvularcula sp. LCG005]|uniref:anthranilate synthase component II n=1 Tax=Parvularcula sp. LCG005 TaxID=3078805 RepID=UPI002942B119|nr:aminodeoxychorismate/anthranilate synthase component II [Parvularcula sp. LCG005]WOI53555.1 aminodeoxychorismate/anthranilate synthase component II [Parvularcula sp. LCG005]